VGNSFRKIARHRKNGDGGSHPSSGNTFTQIAGHRASGGQGVPEDVPKPKHHHHHGGFLSTLKHIATQTPKDLENAALQAPGGLYHLGADLVSTEKQLLTGHGDKPTPFGRDLKGLGKQTVETVRHPLRHPGDTLLLAVPVAGRIASLGEAAALARTGAKASEVAKAATVGVKPGPRVLHVGDAEVRGHYSRSASGRVVQKATDRALEKGAAKHVRVENLLHRRASKWETRNQRTADSIARAAGTRVAVLGAKLKPDELRALRLVAEEVPVERRLGAQEMRKGRAKDAKETARHQERIDVTRAAMNHLTSDSEGRPVFKPEATKLKGVYKALQKASGDREQILKSLDLMDETALQAAKTKVARVAAGARQVRPRTPEEAQARLTKLERRQNTALDNIAGRLFGSIDNSEVRFRNRENRRAARQEAGIDSAGRRSGASGSKSMRRPTMTAQMRAQAEKHVDQIIAKNPNDPVARAWTRRSAEIDHLREALNPDIFEKIDPSKLGEIKSTDLHGAEDVTASPNAIHIGNPVERTKLRGKPKVSSGGTFGHTQKPSSLKTSTGGSVEHALERGDVTNLVAERHAEAVRLGKIDRVVQKFKHAGETVPRRKDDVFMWTDKTVSNERIPKEVREFLDNPESIAKLPPDEQTSLIDKVKQAAFERHDWQADPAKLDEFQKLAKQGKGVFVPRRLLGEFAKSDYQLSGIPGVKFADAVNNAQKTGLIYLKFNYPVVQGVSNAAMNIIHQGFAYPRNVTAAVRLENKLGPEYAAIVDDLMGQGAVVQAQFEGQGTVARASQKLAHIMGSKVDTPARRAAWYHEAIKAGYRTPEKMRALVDEPQNAGDLAEVTQRGREAIVDYSEMGPFERQVVRRLIFVYPWQKGATKYAGHFLRDHPIQAAALAQIGELGRERSDHVFGEVPSYLRGLIPVDGKAVNPSGVNFFQTPAQIGGAVAGFASGDPAQGSAGLGFLAPAPGIAAGLLSGHDDIGRPLKGNVLAKARDLTIGQTPAAAVGRAVGGDYSLVRAILGDQRESKTFPNKNDALWRFLLGGLYPREYNRGALNQNAARQKTGR
jgi:hypothetical protein